MSDSIQWPNTEQDVDSEGYTLENRPIYPGMTRPLRYRGIHTDSCIKTENGWICNDICRVEERRGDKFRYEVSEVGKLTKTLRKVSRLRWYWEVGQDHLVRTFYDGRSRRMKDQKMTYHLFDKGTTHSKAKARKQIVETVEKNMANR